MEYFTVGEVARILQVRPITIRRWLADPGHPLRGVKLGRIWRVPKVGLQRFLKSRGR